MLIRKDPETRVKLISDPHAVEIHRDMVGLCMPEVCKSGYVDWWGISWKDTSSSGYVSPDSIRYLLRKFHDETF